MQLYINIKTLNFTNFTFDLSVSLLTPIKERIPDTALKITVNSIIFVFENFFSFARERASPSTLNS